MSNAGSNAMGFLGGFAQSFGEARSRKRAQSHEEELQREQRQYQMFKDALQVAASRGDMAAVSHTLRSMEQFNTAGKEGGKKGKKAQQGIISQFADLLEKGVPTETQRPTAEAQQAEAKIAQTPEAQLGEATRPRVATEKVLERKPFYTSDEDLARRDIAIEAEKKKTLLPIELSKLEDQNKMMIERQAAAEKEKRITREKILTMQQKAIKEKDVNSLAYAIYEAHKEDGTTEEEAREKAGQIIAGKKEAEVELINKRISKIDTDSARADERLHAQEARWKTLEQQSNRRLAQGDKRLSIASGEGKAITEKAKGIRMEMQQLQTAIKQDVAILTNPLIEDEHVKEAVRERMNRAETAYQEKQKELSTLMDRFDAISNAIPEEHQAPTATPKKAPSTKKSAPPPAKARDIDPMGIMN